MLISSLDNAKVVVASESLIKSLDLVSILLVYLLDKLNHFSLMSTETPGRLDVVDRVM
jgi:hypothetical protein